MTKDKYSLMQMPERKESEVQSNTVFNAENMDARQIQQIIVDMSTMKEELSTLTTTVSNLMNHNSSDQSRGISNFAFSSSVVESPQYRNDSSRNGKDGNQEKGSFSLDDLAREYGEGFTFHGLSRIYSGRLFEQIFWFIVLLGAIVFSGYTFYFLAVKFSSRQIISNSGTDLLSEVPFPSITLCSEQLYIEKSLCYGGNMWTTDSGKTELKPCRKFQQAVHFELIGCMHQNGRANCSVKTKEILDGQCITVDTEGKMYQDVPGELGALDYSVRVHFPVNSSVGSFRRTMDLFLHDNKEEPVISGKGMINGLKLGHSYTVEVERTDVSRLPAPYSSKCVTESLTMNYFPIPYSRRSCLETCYVKDLLRRCNVLNDMWKSYPVRHTASDLRTNKSGSDTKLEQCVHDYYYKYYGTSQKVCKRLCPLPCKESLFEYDSSSREGRVVSSDVIEIQLMYESIEIETIREAPAYTSSQLIADIGGLLGLLAGSSLLSLVEILLFSGFLIARKFV